MRPCSHDHLVGRILIHCAGAHDLDQLVARQVGQIVQRLDALFTELHQHLQRHHLDPGNVVRHAQRHTLLIQLLIAATQMGLRATDQLFGHRFVEALDLS